MTKQEANAKGNGKKLKILKLRLKMRLKLQLQLQPKQMLAVQEEDAKPENQEKPEKLEDAVK